MKYAILIDGDFFLRRYRYLNKKEKGFDPYDAVTIADNMHKCVLRHNDYKGDNEKYSLYRIFYYDCYPLTKKVHNIVTKKSIDFSKTKVAEFRMKFFEELKKKRKVALRLGILKDTNEWVLKRGVLKDLLNGTKEIKDVAEEDVEFKVSQKRVDMKIGIDIASLTYKNHVDRIILISGDSDFVPAAKIARREGIDFILDNMGSNIDPALHEHIDGMRSVFEYKKK
jgi:uncharacterized LabA/DUF88 family protein